MEEVSAKHNLAGIIYNDRDGTVKFLCEGESESISEFVKELKRIRPEVDFRKIGPPA